MDGILIVDKPGGMTSHDVVDFIRRRFAIKKAGHAGTLDPMATGVLVVLVGRATKQSSRFLDQDKTYEARLVFGVSTDTGDSEGRVLSENGPCPDERSVRDIFGSFKGRIEQVPPMFSAKKVNGRKLYELARRGAHVKREPRTVEIKELDITGLDLPEVDFRVRASKGTYIRQLAVDIGERAGCGACLKRLRRTGAGEFGIGASITLERLKAMTREALGESLLRV